MVVHTIGYTLHDIIGAMIVGALVVISFTSAMGRVFHWHRKGLMKVETSSGDRWINPAHILTVSTVYEQSWPKSFGVVIEVAGRSQREVTTFATKRERDLFIKKLKP